MSSILPYEDSKDGELAIESATKVMGWVPVRVSGDLYFQMDAHSMVSGLDWSPSICIENAWVVRERMDDLGFSMRCEDRSERGQLWMFHHRKTGVYGQCTHKIDARAITIAALRAVEAQL